MSGEDVRPMNGERRKSSTLPALLEYSKFPRTPNPISQRSPDQTIKRLIVLCDGTWKASDAGPPNIPTNITRFARALDCVEMRDDQEIQQIVYYQNGLGTGDLLKLQYLAAGSMAFGLDDNVRAAYAFLANNYQHGLSGLPDDEIYLFGFSRGAYTARAIAGLISKVGLLTKRGMDDFNLIYEEYKRGAESFENFTQQRMKESSNGIPWESQIGITVKVIGCFDTVGSVGLPENAVVKWLQLNKGFGFFQTELSEGVENAFHALALDEKRSPFTPTLWYIPHTKKGDNPPPLRLSHTNSFPGMSQPGKTVNLQQCWFPGVHSNVGGGYADHTVADITLSWMVDRCQPFLKFDWSYLLPICTNTELRTVLKTTQDYHVSEVGIKRIPTIEKIGVRGRKGYAQGTIYDSSSGFPFNLWWSSPRTPGRYQLDGLTNEYIHPSVRIRFQTDPEYAKHCTALQGMEVVHDDKTGKWVWKHKDSGAEIQEAEFGFVDRQAAFTEGNDLLDKFGSMEMRLAGIEGMNAIHGK